MFDNNSNRYAFLRVSDVATTFVGVRMLGAGEFNPLMDELIQHSFLLYTFIQAIGLLAILLLMRTIKNKHSGIYDRMFLILNGFTSFIVAMNVISIILILVNK